MRHETQFASVTPAELAAIGSGHIAYMRQLSGKQINEAFPSKISIEPEAHVWALFGADGAPIMLAGGASAALAGAFQNDLVPVAVH